MSKAKAPPSPGSEWWYWQLPLLSVRVLDKKTESGYVPIVVVASEMRSLPVGTETAWHPVDFADKRPDDAKPGHGPVWVKKRPKAGK